MNKWMKSTALESWLYSNYIPLPWKFFKHLPLLTRPAISQGPAMMQSVDCWIFNFLSHHSSTELPQWLLNRTHHNYLWDLKEDVCIHTHTHTHTHTHIYIYIHTYIYIYFLFYLLKGIYFADKGLSSQSYGFSSSHVWMWELDNKESWAPKNWCFCTVVLEKTPESPLDCKKIIPVNCKGNQSWIFIGSTEAEAEAPILGHLMQRTDSFEKTVMLGKIEGKGRKGWQSEYEMVGWHHWFDGHEFE